jgi:prepilin peptidase CpaA
MQRLLSSETFICLALLIAVIGAVVDFKTGHIPNWLTLGGLALGAGLHLLRGASLGGLSGLRVAGLFVFTGVLLCGIVPLMLWRVAGMGGGDLKLLVALGAVCGAMLGLQAQVYAFAAMLLYVAAKFAYQGKLLKLIWRSARLALRPFQAKDKKSDVPGELFAPMRFGPAIFVGLAAALLENIKL